MLLKRRNLSFVLMYVMTDAYSSLCFSAIFSASLLSTLTGAFWCHPSTCCKDKGIEIMKTSQCQSLFGCTHPSLFHVFGRSLLGISQNKTEVRCVIVMSKKVFPQLFPQSSHRDIQPWIVSTLVLTFLSKSFSLIGRSVGSVWTSLQTSHYLCLRVSHWVAPYWSVATQFAYEAVIYKACLSTSTVCMPFTFHPYSCRRYLWNPVCLVKGWQPRRCPFFYCFSYELLWLSG